MNGLPPVRPLATLAPALRRRMVRAIWQWERHEYGSGQCRALGAIKGRLAHFDAGLLCSIDGAQLLGYVDILPLAPSNYAPLRDGRVIEERIPSRWVDTRRRPGSAYWYIGSMIVAPQMRADRPDLAHIVAGQLREATWAFIAARGRFPVRVLGISATAAGRSAFLRTGFRPVAPGADAADPRPRFEQLFQSHAQLTVRTRKPKEQ